MTTRASVDLSVVIPAHNAEGFICEAIQSVFMQTGVSLEVIVVDNLSTDRTVDVVAATFGDSVLLTSESTPGPGPARNAGVRLARGKHLAFLDADDVWLAGKTERQLQELSRRPGIDLAFTHCQEFHDPDLPDESRNRFPCRPNPYPCITPSTALFQRALFQSVGGFPNVTGGEFIAWYGWCQSLGFKSYVLPDILVRRRVHGANTTLNRATLAGYPAAAKWLLDRRRQAAQQAQEE